MTQARIVSHTVRWLVALLAVLTAAEVAAGAEVKGRVVDPEGNAVKAAKVYLVQSTLDENRASQPVLSDADGKFTIPIEREPKEQGGEMVMAVADKFGIVAANVRNDNPVEIKLVEPIAVTIPFVDEEGRPVRDLRVRTYQLSMGGIESGWFLRPPKDMPWLSGRTDGNGEVIMKNCPRGARLWLAVDDERFVFLSWETTFIVSNEETMRARPIQLLRAASVKGRLTFPDGKPASGLRVGAAPIHPTSGYSMDFSDGEGFYHLKQLSKGNYNISITIKDEMKSSWTAAAIPITLNTAEQRRDVDLKLIAGGVIKGKVMAEDNGEGIPKIYVGLHGPAHPKNSSQVDMCYTAEDGSYLLRTPPGEQYVYLGMGVAPEGFKTPKGQAGQTVNVADGQTLEVNFKLSRGPRTPVVSGRVVDEDGKAVGDSIIWIEPAGRYDQMAHPYQGRSKADGSFQFKLMYPEAKVRAKKDQMATLAAVVVKGNEDQQLDLKVETNALATVSGMVVDARGDILVGAKVNLTEMYGSYGTGGDVASTGKEGTFKIEGLWPDGNYSLSVSAPGRGQFSAGKLKLQPGGVLDLGKMTLKDLGSFVAGTVFDPQGKPAGGVSVMVSNGKETPFTEVTSDKEGKFRIPVASGDELNIQARVGEGFTTLTKVFAGNENIELIPRPMRQAR
jgi:protocatechuate 3,4-dioxygenase beta subunit